MSTMQNTLLSFRDPQTEAAITDERLLTSSSSVCLLGGTGFNSTCSAGSLVLGGLSTSMTYSLSLSSSISSLLKPKLKAWAMFERMDRVQWVVARGRQWQFGSERQSPDRNYFIDGIGKLDLLYKRL